METATSSTLAGTKPAQTTIRQGKPELNMVILLAYAILIVTLHHIIMQLTTTQDMVDLIKLFNHFCFFGAFVYLPVCLCSELIQN